MIETFYRTGSPQNGKPDCCVLVLARRAGSDGRTYLFMKEHGCWDEGLQQFVYRVESIGADSELTYETAHHMYEAARRQLQTDGFAFSMPRTPAN